MILNCTSGTTCSCYYELQITIAPCLFSFKLIVNNVQTFQYFLRFLKLVSLGAGAVGIETMKK